jgi:Mn2+/Fe2+ NRAMP family transporter
MADRIGSGVAGGQSFLRDNRPCNSCRGSNQLFRLDPKKALFFSAVINGVVAVPVMAMMMLITSNKAIMGRFAIVGGRRIIGWLATAIMATAAIGMVLTGVL